MQFSKLISDRTLQKQIAMFFVLGALGWFLFSGSSSVGSATSKAFYSTDDGQTVFADSAEKLSPITHYGSTAYRTAVFSTDGGKTKIIAYMERYTPSGKARLAPLIEEFKKGKLPVPPAPQPGEIEVKLPGANNSWVSTDSSEGAAVKNAKIPANGDSDFEVLLP